MQAKKAVKSTRSPAKRPQQKRGKTFERRVQEFYRTIGTPVYPLPVGEWHPYDLSDATAATSASESLAVSGK